MADQTLTCQDCGTNFTFTDSEQQFFAEKGYTNAPGRCSDCRRVRREGGGGSSARGRERTMTDITCSACGKPAQVPFVPRGDRPVYCSDCHTKQQGASPSYGSRGGGGGGGSRRY